MWGAITAVLRPERERDLYPRRLDTRHLQEGRDGGMVGWGGRGWRNGDGGGSNVIPVFGGLI